MIACCGSRHIGDRVATLTHINRSFKDQRCCVSNGNVADTEDASCCTVGTLRHDAVIGSRCQSRWKEVIQENTRCKGSTIVGDFNQECDNVALFGIRITTGKCFDRDQIGIRIDDHCFIKIVTCSARIGLIACCGSRHIGDRVATLTYINRTFQRQRRCLANVQRANVKQAGCRIVASLRNRSVSSSGRQTWWQEVSQANVCCLSRTVIGDHDFKSHRVAFFRCAVAADKRLDRY